MKRILLIPFIVLLIGCKQQSTKKEDIVLWQPYNDSVEVAESQSNKNPRMQYKLVQSKFLDKNEVFLPLYPEVQKLSDSDYQRLKPIVFEKNMLQLRSLIEKGELTYEELVLFYLYRIYKYELNNDTTLNTILALNSNVVDEARTLDEKRKKGTEPSFHHPIYGMPILLKDNINTKGMKTTAGSVALLNNEVEDAFIVKKLKEKGALILGKANLSEWAYFMCSGCPVGYSAVGGQTLNPYGRKIFETGGSSSGSGTSMAASYAVAAVGTETSGSILSPSSQNSVVGLKPTIGLLSRTGIVPISSTLDTPGPMTRNVVDAAILLSAMRGKDPMDAKSVEFDQDYTSAGLQPILEGKRFGAIKQLLENDSIYRASVEKLKTTGAEVIEVTPPQVGMNGFLSILNIDMKNDLPAYLKANANEGVKITDMESVIAFNSADSAKRIPYGQALFHGIVADTTSAEGLEKIIANLEKNGRHFFDAVMDEHKLDAVLSINNYHAGYAAVAKYPAITVPMGYKKSGEPISLTFIGKQFQERKLLELAAGFEEVSKVRKAPKGFD